MHIPLSHIVYVGWTCYGYSGSTTKVYQLYTSANATMVRVFMDSEAFAYVITCPKWDFLYGVIFVLNWNCIQYASIDLHMVSAGFSEVISN